MAKITGQEPIRYALDKLATETYGVLYTNTGSELDFSGISQINSINLNYLQPANTGIYLAFGFDNAWHILTKTGSTQISTAQPTFETLKAKGNRPQDFNGSISLSPLIGKKVKLAIGLYTADSLNAIPRCKISFSCATTSQLLSHTEYSPIYNFDDFVTLNDITFTSETSSGASVKVYASGIDSEGNNISWSDSANLEGQKIRRLQFRADYYVPNAGTAFAQVNSVNAIYSSSQAVTSGVTSGEIISLTQDWYLNITQSRMTVKHAILENASISAYCALRRRPKRASNETLGIGSGARKTFQLANVEGLKYDTIRLFYDNQPIYSMFEFNTQTGRITCEAPEGVIVSCSYEYGWENETWQKMTLASRYELDGVENSEFRFATNETDKSVCAVKIVLEMSEGKISTERLGTGAGITQTYRLSHKVKDGKITIYQNGSQLPAKNYYVMDDTQYVRIAANYGATLTATYDWISETPEVYQFAAVFSGSNK